VRKLLLLNTLGLIVVVARFRPRLQIAVTYLLFTGEGSNNVLLTGVDLVQYDTMIIEIIFFHIVLNLMNTARTETIWSRVAKAIILFQTLFPIYLCFSGWHRSPLA
jgi:hypothetical protein